jgi:hypothetical protein
MNSFNLLKLQAERFNTAIAALETHLAFKRAHTVLEKNNMYFSLKHALEE